MARLEQIPEPERTHLLAKQCPVFEKTPWVTGPPLPQRRVVIISTAGLHRRGDRPFSLLSDDYRVIPGDIPAADLVMSHTSTNFDRTGFQNDINVIFPLDRLRDLAGRGIIGGVADYHYSFMGAADPRKLEPTVRALAALIGNDRVDAVLLVPV